MRQRSPEVLVVLGTDVHKFDRLVHWVDDWAGHRCPTPTVFVQHGSSRPPVLGEGAPLLPHAELLELMSRAEVVITHGGPGTIMEVRRAGKLPVVVPRDPSLREHVDGHQQRFTQRMAGAGRLLAAETQERFSAVLDEVWARPELLALQDAGGGPAETTATVERVGQILDDLLQGQQSRTARLGRLLARQAAFGSSGRTARSRGVPLDVDLRRVPEPRPALDTGSLGGTDAGRREDRVAETHAG